MSDMISVLSRILEYQEVQLLFRFFNMVLYVVIAFLVLLITVHVLYGFSSHVPLYRKRAPVEGWQQRFYPAALLLIGILALIAYEIDHLFLI